MYAAAWQAFLAHPMGLLTGSLRMWQQYLPFHGHHAFTFVRFGRYSDAAQAACYALSAFGVVLCFRRPYRRHYLLLAAAALGHLASIPLAPPIDGGLRVYAATIPILALLVALAGGELASRARQLRRRTHLGRATTEADTVGRHGRKWVEATIGFGVVLAVFATVGPLVTLAVSRPPRFAELPCPPGQRAVYLRLSDGSFLRIVDDAQGTNGRRVRVPEIRATALRTEARVAGIGSFVDRLTSGHTLMNTHDLKTGAPFWVVAPTDRLPPAPSLVRMGGYPIDEYFGGHGVFYAESVESAERR